MAKGNMLQGMARGKVGDVVFSRLDGEQISRVRNRHPHNPRTNSQLYQRAIMATVMQAYSAGKEIFDHAFEGYAVGAANQRRFLSLNAKKLRETIAAEIAAGTAVASQNGRVVAPGVKAPVPAKYKVSAGSLPSIIKNGSFPEANENETVAAYCSRMGFVDGDIFTFVGFQIADSEDPLFTVNNQTSNYAKQFPCTFVAIRMEFLSSALSDTNALTNLGQFLEVTKTINCTANSLNNINAGDALDFGTLVSSSYEYGAYGTIHSRKDEDLRSDCELVMIGWEQYGLATQYALAAWQQGTVLVGDSDLILEGGDGGNVL